MRRDDHGRKPDIWDAEQGPLTVGQDVLAEWIDAGQPSRWRTVSVKAINSNGLTVVNELGEARDIPDGYWRRTQG